MARIRDKQRDIRRNNRQINRKTGFYYSFFTIVLIFCLIQIGYGAILNVGKIISYKGKMVTLENLLKKAQMHNEDLKAEKKVVTSDNSLEGIARNNLKMAGEDEILVVINEKPEEVKPKKKNFEFKWFDNFRKDIKHEKLQPAELPNVPPEVSEE